MKHRLKKLLREAWARFLFHTGLWLVVDRIMPRRMLVMGGHCVEHPECNGSLSADMKISAAHLSRLLACFSRRFELCTVAGGAAALENPRGRSLVALSMDDGYRDNVEVLLPLLQKSGATATIYLESRPLDERRVNWTHKYFWLLERLGPQAFVVDFVAASRDDTLRILLQQVAAEGERLEYLLKRKLKYDADQPERDRVIDALFEQYDGDERALCDRLYMSWDDARKLRDAGIELGGHTETHPVLSGLGPEEQAAEITTGRNALIRELGGDPESFAYPFGRHWDFDSDSTRAVLESGFKNAVTTHAGTYRKGDDPLRIKRWMIDDKAQLHLLATEACGGFDLLRKLGLDLSE